MRYAEIQWHTRAGKTRTIVVTDHAELQGWINKLRAQDEFFVCYPNDYPIPRNKG